MKTAKDVLKSIKENEVKYVDLRFTDPRGKWQHVTFDITMVDDDFLTDGTMFDGSSIAGWKAINESDMCLMPDPVTATIDPFFAETTMVLTCDVLEPTTGQPYNRDPRGIAKKAEAMVKSTGVGDTVFFGPEAEFFVFDDVRFRPRPTTPASSSTPPNCRSTPAPNMRAAISATAPHQGRLFPGAAGGLRAGHARRDARRHGQDGHQGREASPRSGVGPARTRHEVRHADADGRPHADLQILHPPGRAHLRQDGHLHAEAGLWRQRLGHALPPVDLEGRQAAVRRQQICRPLGDLPLLHRRHHQARQGDQRLHQPLTNSYKRLVPGYEAPVLLAYSARNRSASCRIPYTSNPKAKRVEVRFPDPMANPYLGFAAMLMAGLDGIENKIDPGPAMDKDLYDLPPEELKAIPTVCGSLREALENLDKDRAFLKNGGVFDDDFIDAYIELKMSEVERFEMTPHPVEFEMYYSL